MRNQLSLKCTFPSFAREDGSEDQEAPPSVNLLLLRETFTKFPGRPFVDASADDFLPDDDFCLFESTLSTKSPTAVALFVGVRTLISSFDDLTSDCTLLSSALDGVLSLVDFLGTYIEESLA